MHEFSVETRMVDAVIDELSKYKLEKVNSVTVMIGALTNLGDEQMSFAYEIVTRGTILEGSELIIEHIPVEAQCESCGYTGPVRILADPDYETHSIPVLSGVRRADKGRQGHGMHCQVHGYRGGRAMFKYRDEETAKKILDHIRAMDVDVRLMHICGTHQDAIVRFGLEEMLNDVGVSIAQGPGCPVCVTTSAEIADAITLARNGVTVAAFGDMMRVPTTIGSLFSAKADGADVRIVYSIDDAVQMARDEPGRPLVFVGVGFETTAPSTCVPIRKDDCPENFSVYSCHRICPPIIETLFDLGENRIDGFIMPGHVAVITGTGMFEPVSKKHHVPQVIAGFEPLDILMSCYMLCKQIKEGRAEVENEYTRLVRPEGNPAAMRLMEETFVPVDRAWRGFPIIPKSALALKPEFEAHDATKVHEDILRNTPEVEAEAKGCRCGDVLRGIIRSEQCPMFGKVCKPMNPMGPCMVSAEGNCSIAYRLGSKRL